jgi:hypothetical protein
VLSAAKADREVIGADLLKETGDVTLFRADGKQVSTSRLLHKPTVE